MDVHEMEGYEEGNVTVWHCPICGRKVLITMSDASIIEPGNRNVNHRGGTDGFTIGAVVAREIGGAVPPGIAEDDGPFEQWADENAERLFEADYPSP